MFAGIARIIAPLLYPIGFIWFLVMMGAIVFLIRRKLAPAIYLAFIGTVIWIIGATPIPDSLLITLERPYVRNISQPLPEADVVLMLGGLLDDSEVDFFGMDLTSAGDRAFAALELMRLGKAKALVLGGGGNTIEGKQFNESEILERWFRAWQVPRAPVHRLPVCASTAEEAIQFEKLIQQHGWKRVHLVTSAYHMRRSEAIFRKLPITVIPHACDFNGLNGPRMFRWVPTMHGFINLKLYIHEVFGWHVYKFQGWLKA